MNLPQYRIDSPHKEAILGALQYQGKSNDCGPFTIATVINAVLNASISGLSLSKEMAKPLWQHNPFMIRRIPNWATFPWGMVEVFREHGLPANWRIGVKITHLLSQLPKENILIPIIGSWRPLVAHVMTLIVWDPHRGWGFANTQFDDKKVSWLENEQFFSKWRSFCHLLIEVKRPIT